jgi:hypothetical protein
MTIMSAAKLAPAVVVLAAAFTAPTPAHAAPAPTSHCDLSPTDRDLIIWQKFPRLIADALEVGDVNLALCRPTLDSWRDGTPTGPGYCSKIAWAADNPGYDVEIKPAPPLKKVLDTVGDC